MPMRQRRNCSAVKFSRSRSCSTVSLMSSRCRAVQALRVSGMLPAHSSFCRLGCCDRSRLEMPLLSCRSHRTVTRLVIRSRQGFSQGGSSLSFGGCAKLCRASIMHVWTFTFGAEFTIRTTCLQAGRRLMSWSFHPTFGRAFPVQCHLLRDHQCNRCWLYVATGAANRRLMCDTTLLVHLFAVRKLPKRKFTEMCCR